MRSIFFPLRSNVGWFSNADTAAALQRKIKSSLILYDHLAFQDGRWHLTVLESGSSGWMLGANAIQGSRDQITYYQPGQPYVLSASRDPDGPFLPVLQGPSVESFEVDFYPILDQAGILRESYIEMADVVLTDAGKQRLQAGITHDLRNEQLTESIPGNYWIRKDVIESIHYDSLLSQSLGHGLTTDARISGFIAAKNVEIAGTIWQLDLAPAVLGTLVHFRIPDFGAMGWDDVLKVRESRAGEELRRMLHRMTERIAEELPNLESEHEITLLTASLFIDELLREVQALTPDVGGTVVGLGLNFIPLPFAGTISAIRDLASLVTAKQSWISLVSKPL